jgi:hypothetical protein
MPALGGHLGGPCLGAPVAGPIVQTVQVDPIIGAPIAGPLLWVLWVGPALALGVCLQDFRHLAVDADGKCLHASHLLLVFKPPVAFFSCFFLAAMATATAPAAPSSPMLFQRIQREGLMLKGVMGVIVLFYLIWLVTRRLLGKK